MSKKNDTGEKQDYMNLDWLNHQYYVLGRRIQEIADDQNVSMIRIRKWLAKLEEPIDMIFSPYCPYCGKHVKSHWKVCAYCGQRIRGMELYPIKEEALPKEEIVVEEPIKEEGLPMEEVVIEESIKVEALQKAGALVISYPWEVVGAFEQLGLKPIPTLLKEPIREAEIGR